MTLMIDLNPEQEARLTAAAKQTGLAPEELALKLVTDHLPLLPLKNESPSTLSSRERAKAYREWAESHARNTPLLSEEAISRESIYGERG